MTPQPTTAARPPQPVWGFLKAFLPAPIQVDGRERLRAVAGALLGLALTATVSRWLVQQHGDSLQLAGVWLLAPFGASAVLVFAAPASPLAQPWSVLGGNALSALVGLLCAAWVPDPVLASAAAVGLAIAVMFSLRCLHPPGGAMALSAVLAHASGGQLPLATVLGNAVLLVAAGVAYNTLTGRRYPHTQWAPSASAAGPAARFRPEDLEAVLARYNQVLDVSRDDLAVLLHDTELTAYRRRMSSIRCRDIMSREVVAVEFGSPLPEAWKLMKEHQIKALPVIDRSRRIVGIITRADFMRAAAIDGPEGLVPRLRDFLRPDGLLHSDKPAVVGQIMTRNVRVVSEDRHVFEVMPLFTEAGHHHIPVIDAERRIAGILTQSDVVRALYQRDA